MNASLPFGLRCAAASCQDATSLFAKHLNNEGLCLLNYIDDFMGVAPSKGQAEAHFNKVQTTLDHLELVKAKHKVSPLPQVMKWLELRFNTINMTITIPQENLVEIATLWTSHMGRFMWLRAPGRTSQV